MKKTENKIPAEFWNTAEGKNICNTMHSNAWDALDCLNAEINALTTACENTENEEIKAILEKAKAKVVAARASCRKAMEILTDGTF